MMIEESFLQLLVRIQRPPPTTLILRSRLRFMKEQKATIVGPRRDLDDVSAALISNNRTKAVGCRSRRLDRQDVKHKRGRSFSA